MKLQQQLNVALPAWMRSFTSHWMDEFGATLNSPEQRMQLAVALSAENLRQETGGPFGAIVVEEETGRLVGMGVNLVTRSHMSAAHAEIVALSLAQKAMKSWNLGVGAAMQLVTSCEPCAMCFGAVPWSGVRSLVCGARKGDAEAAGFDEGDKPLAWVSTLEQRGIRVKRDILREPAVRVLQEYIQGEGAIIYHPGKTSR